jgi:RNA polymerase sigma factor (sigma-70 family)
LSPGRPSLNRDRRAELLALAGELRPDLHRYRSRLMGSVIDGEDVVQDTLVRAFVALEDLEEAPPLRPRLFRIAHNRALDLLRGREVRMAEPIDAAADIADPTQPDPLEMLMRKEAVKTAVSRFVELPSLQRSVVILKDVLDESLIEIADLLDLGIWPGVARISERSTRMAARLRTRGRPPLRWRVMSRCSTSGTGTACARCWPTTSGSINRYTRFASAVRMSVCSSLCTPRSTACRSPRPGSRVGR